MDGREIRISSAAKKDLEWLAASGFTTEDWQELKKCLTRVSRRKNVIDDSSVCALRMCKDNDPVWYRFKHASMGVRVAFEVDERTMTVWAILRRSDNTYRIVEARLKG